MIKSACLLGVAIMAAPLPALAQSTPAPMPAVPTVPVISPERMELGRQIARALNSDAAFAVQADKLFGETMPQAMRSNPDIAAAEAKYPGLIAYMITQARPLLESSMRARAPQMIDRLGNIYASSLTVAELKDALVFYRSPTGLWLIDQITRGTDLGPMLNAYANDPDTKIDAGDLNNAINGAKPRILAGMTKERAAEILRFGGSPAGRKIMALNPLILSSVARWTNESDPEMDKQIETVMAKAVADFIAMKKKTADSKITT